MIRLVLALAGALALGACGAPEDDRTWPAPAPALWQVSGEHGEQAWLFGTIHALPDGVAWRTPQFERAFAASDLLMVEIGNLGDARDARRAFEAFAKGPPQPPLSTRVAPADRPALTALMARAGLTDDDFWNVETWAAALMLSNAARDSEAGNGVDRALLGEGKPVEALESFTQQFDRFDRLPAEDQRALLAGVAREAQTEQADERVVAWLTGDLAALERQMAGEFLGSPGLRGALLVERNRDFASRIATSIEQRRKPFVAVGAGHMIGPDGLPALLAARGYTVTRLR